MAPLLLSDIVLEDLPPEFIVNLLKRLRAGYADSRVKAASSFQDAETRYILPHIRKSLCEQIFRETALDAGFRAQVKPNSKNNYDYTLVEAGRLSLTISHVNSLTMPRPAKLRSQYSEVNQHLRQRDLLNPNQDSRPGPGAVYGILVHHLPEIKNEAGEYSYEDGVVSIGFPNLGCRKWLDTVCLYETRDKQKLKASAPADLQAAVQNPAPKLKPTRNVSGGDAG